MQNEYNPAPTEPMDIPFGEQATEPSVQIDTDFVYKVIVIISNSNIM